jgi:hypothetical protein
VSQVALLRARTQIFEFDEATKFVYGLVFWMFFFGFITHQLITPHDKRPHHKPSTQSPPRSGLVQQTDAPNYHAFGTFVTHPADAGSVPKASGSR